MSAGPSDFALRPLARRDAALLEGFLVRNRVREVTDHFHPFPLTGQTARELTAHEGRDRYYVVETSATIIALSMLRGWDAGYVVPSFGIVVDRDWQGRGIGGRLTDFTIEEARRLGSSSVRLSVYESNVGAHRLYAARGFREQSRERVDTPYGVDYRIVMSKDLSV